MSAQAIPERLRTLRSGAEKSVFRALNRGVVPAVRAGIGSPLVFGGGVVVLETTGRVSGKRREVPLVAVRTGNTLTVSTVRRDSHWVGNLESDPDAAVWLNGRRMKVAGSVRRGPLNVATLTLAD